MATTRWPALGIYIASIAPTAPFPCTSEAPQVFRVTFVIAVSDDQQMRLDIEVSAYSLNQAAQDAYAKAAMAFGELSQLAKDASDHLLAKAGN